MTTPADLAQGRDFGFADFTQTSRIVVYAISFYAIVVGLISLLGWVADIERLTDIFSSGIAIQPNTAVCAFLAGLGVLSIVVDSKLGAVICGMFVALIAVATLVQYVATIDLGIDQLLTFGRAWGDTATTTPGRMGLPAATAWTLVGLALCFPVIRSRSWQLAPVVGILVSILMFPSLSGYFFGASALFSVPPLTAVSLQTSTILFLIGIGLILDFPNSQPLKTLLERSAAGALARRALPFIILIPPVLAYLRQYGEVRGLYSSRAGSAARTVIEVLLFSALLSWAVKIVRDHERRAQTASKGLAERERDLNDFFETASVGLHFVGPDGTILRANRAELDLLGYSPEEYIGHNIAEFHVNRSTVEDIMNRLSNGETLHEYPGQMRRKDGGVVDVVISSSVLFESGEFKHTRCLTRDVSEIKRAERAQELLANIVEASDDAIVSKTLDGIILSWNRGAERIFGYRPDEVIGRSIMTIVPPELRDEEHDILARLRRGERIEHFETKRLAKDGRLLDVSLTISPLRDPSGNLFGASKVARDITERKRNEEKLREADARKDVFLATLAHELRNPLAPISNSLELIKVADGNRELTTEAREMAERQLQHMVRLIDDLLDISRITRNKLELRRETMDLTAVVRNACAACGRSIDENGLEIQISLPDGPVFIDADPVRISQVINNLLSNAIKFNQQGGAISVVLEERGDEAVIRIKDTGAGIPSDMLEKVFEMFTQVDRAPGEQNGGLGIGLALSKRLVEMHGGTISVDSSGRDQGSEFIINLPVLSNVPASASAAHAEKAHLTTVAKKILVVDDNRDSADSLAILLTMQGNKCEIAEDGVEALEKAESFRPDVVLLDIGLPRMNGFDVCKAIRNNPWGENILIIAMTGWGQPEDRRQTAEAGFDHHLVKPIEHGVLLDLLDKDSQSGKPNATLDVQEV